MVQAKLKELRQQRLNKVEAIRQLGINPYPSFFSKKHSILFCRENLGQSVQTAGRIMSLRGHGKILFADLQDDVAKIQLFFQQKNFSADIFSTLKLVDIGDFVGVEGEVIKTVAGEITINVTSFQFLSKAIRPLPGKWHGLKDTEERFRKRYLDLILNPKVKNRIKLRSDLVKHIRQFLDQEGYIEVETPALQTLYGGTNARPFHTHLNALDIDMYLRVADELYLKRCVIGGFEKVFEITKDFRNEGMDQTHQPEFTMIEYYEAYADYQKIMTVTESMIKHLANKLFGKEEITLKGKEISLSGAWPRIEMTKLLQDHLSIDVDASTSSQLLKFALSHKIESSPADSKGMLVYKIFDHLIPEKLIQPTWVIDYPIEASPLSKKHPTKPGFVERFEGYIGGVELFDGWSEINDPIDQRLRFEQDQEAMRQGSKDDAHPVDEDFITALEYGMPPLGGIGIGIDRLTMFFTDTWSIREIIIFPLMRPKKQIKHHSK